jgi:streptomycin 6-kinase
LADIPIVRRFVQRWPHGGAQPIKDFYEKNALLEKAHATRSKVLKEGGRDDDAPPVVQRVRNYATRMSQLQSLIRQLNIDKKLNAKEKRQKIDAAYLDLLNTAQLGLKAIKEHGSVVRQPTNDPWRVVN